MLKISIAAAVSFVALSFAPVPLLVTPALAQCTAVAGGPNCRPPAGSEGADTYTCGNELGLLRRVYEEELEVIDNPLNVAVVPVCTGEDYGVMRSDGNAGALRQVIAQNDAMTDALDVKNFGSDDVVGIRMTSEDKVILYVHEFHRR